MKRLTNYNLIVIFIFSIQLGKAQPKGYKAIADASSFTKNFNEYSNKIKTNEADFIQEKYISVMTEKIITKGKFYFKKENLLRWETTEPSSSILVLNNGKMIVKENNKVKTFDSNSNKQLKGLNDIMLTTASGNMLQSKEYSYTLFENEHYYLTELTPIISSTKKVIKSIEVLVDKKDYSVAQLKIIEPSSDYIKIEFSNKKSNYNIDNQLFILK